MSSKIKRLPDELINLISAGEVVERPVSVVKELVENSIDAKSTMITIELIDGGIKKIKVIDNGTGMEPDDIPFALTPHSTSKITSKLDLFNIKTLGFRGEALPSIASVSKFKIASKQANQKLGFYYHYLNGQITSSGNVPMKDGTIVEVEDLFYNTPARYKHLSSNYTENSHIIDYIYKSALSHPEISFTLINNQKVIYQTNSGNDILELIGITYGINIVKSMLAFEGKNSLYTISGYTSNNQAFRANKLGITIFVNERIIRNQNLIYAITDAYKSIIPIGKYPFCILKITTDPTLIDVNVHPSKLEIRFTDEMQLRSLITKTLTKVLFETPLIYQDITIDNKNTPDSFSNNSHSNDDYLDKIKETEDLFDNLETLEETNIVDNYQKVDNLSWNDFDNDEEDEDEDSRIDNLKTLDSSLDNSNQPNKIIPENTLFDDDKSFFSKMHYIGQFNKTYLILETNNELYLIDQHAAAERVNYEKIVDVFNNYQHMNAKLELLVPIMLDFNVVDIPSIDNILSELSKIGIEMIYFGGTTYKLESIPVWIKQGTEIESIQDIVMQLLNKEHLSIAKVYDNIAKSVSCKKSLKANMLIKTEEVNQLLNDLDQCKMPYTCPHGRPTLIKFSLYELEKLFKRVV